MATLFLQKSSGNCSIRKALMTATYLGKTTVFINIFKKFHKTVFFILQIPQITSTHQNKINTQFSPQNYLFFQFI